MPGSPEYLLLSAGLKPRIGWLTYWAAAVPKAKESRCCLVLSADKTVRAQRPAVMCTVGNHRLRRQAVCWPGAGPDPLLCRQEHSILLGGVNLVEERAARTNTVDGGAGDGPRKRGRDGRMAMCCADLVGGTWIQFSPRAKRARWLRTESSSMKPRIRFWTAVRDSRKPRLSSFSTYIEAFLYLDPVYFSYTAAWWRIGEWQHSKIR